MKIYLALGSNLGDKSENMREALRLLACHVGKVTRVSSFWETEPWGFSSENTFLNAVAELNTELSPRALLLKTQEVERAIGRRSKSSGGQYADRLIDIDILLYGNMIINESDLKIPHPLLLQRRFVMDPLVEIAPEVVHPVEKKMLTELYGKFF